MPKTATLGWVTRAAPPLRDLRAAYYQVKAEECLLAAEAATHNEVREQLLALANRWSMLVWHLRNNSGREADEED
jgi:hypothetical protein